MSANPGGILVFRTNVKSMKDVKNIRPVLDDLCGTTGKWNFDLEDCDGILRVEIPGVLPQSIIWHVQEIGFFCQELDDMIYPPVLGGDHGTAGEEVCTRSHAASAG